MFWFEIDLSFIYIKKNMPKQHHGWQKIKKNKRIGMLIKNDKLTTKNNKDVEKAHLKHQGY
jgi:hypothetical protein